MVAGHDLFVDGGHEVEVVGAEGAGDPHLGRRPVAARVAVGVDGDPVGVGGFGVVVGGVGVGADEDGHVEFAAAGDELAEDVAVVEPGAAMVEGDLRWVVGDAASAAEADAVGARALEVVEPEGGVEVDGVVFDEGELRPALGFGGPGGDGLGGCGCPVPRDEPGANATAAPATVVDCRNSRRVRGGRLMRNMVREWQPCGCYQMRVMPKESSLLSMLMMGMSSASAWAAIMRSKGSRWSPGRRPARRAWAAVMGSRV